MASKYKLMAGDTAGKWTLLKAVETEGKVRKWLCRCECGTEKYVLERSIIYGTTRSCGCMRNAVSGRNLVGERFGSLKVTERHPGKDARCTVRWRCECDCGKVGLYKESELTSGRRTSCGCQNAAVFCDITGKQFGKLTAMYPLERSDARRSKLWHCRCECGNEIDIPYNTLLYSNTKSCGCVKKEHDRILCDFLQKIDGTSIDHLRSKKIPSNNTSGVKGVNRNRQGKYVTRITFQKKQYWLGSYSTLEEAAEVRRAAEHELNERAVSFYEKWNAIANENPSWGELHPISMRVIRDAMSIRLEILPELSDAN